MAFFSFWQVFSDPIYLKLLLSLNSICNGLYDHKDAVRSRWVMDAHGRALKYRGIIERPATLIELDMGSVESECEICKVDPTSTPEGIGLRSK